jgi:type IV secretion system protein VirB5
MRFSKRALISAFLAVGCIAGYPAAAIIPVTDVGAIVQLISQLQVLEQQVETAKRQLDQAQSEYQSITGGRGMEQLLSGVVRNYLPATWNDLQSALSGGSGGYGALAGEMTSALAANSVLSADQLAALAVDSRAVLAAARRNAALQQVLAQQPLATASDRFSSLQQLVAAIGSASDQKAILDLQARIGAEQAMLENDSIKLAMLHQAALAEGSANAQREREQIVARHGQFASRFQPLPPARSVP